MIQRESLQTNLTKSQINSDQTLLANSPKIINLQM